MKRKQPCIDIPGNRLEVCEGRSLWMVGTHFKKRIKYSVKNVRRGPRTWWPLKLTLHYLQSVSRTKFHKTMLDMPLNVTEHVWLFFFFIHWIVKAASPFQFGVEVIWKSLCIYACASAFREVLHLQRHPVTQRLLKCFSSCLHLDRFFSH